MRFPDAVTVLRPAGTDEYGNPGTSWATPSVTEAVGFLSGLTCFLPPDADVQRGDRLEVAGVFFDVEGAPAVLRSPSRSIVTAVKLQRRET